MAKFDQPLLADTTDPDPDHWLIVSDRGRVFLGTLTQLLIAELVGVGLDLTSFELGDPGEWAWPYWGRTRPGDPPPRNVIPDEINNRPVVEFVFEA